MRCATSDEDFTNQFAPSRIYDNGVMVSRALIAALLAAACLAVAAGQVIEFESGGLRYQTLTKNGVTVMYAHMLTHVREYSILQVAVSNGAKAPYLIRPEDFSFLRSDGNVIRAASAKHVVD